MARPDMKEFMDATGVDSRTASELLYGAVGSNVDIRDWDAIMSSSDPEAAARAGIQAMYSGPVDVSNVPEGSYGRPDYDRTPTGGGTAIRDFGDGRIGVFDSSGNLLSSAKLGSNQSLNESQVQTLLTRGASLADINEFTGGNYTGIEATLPGQQFIRSDAAELAAEAQRKKLERLPLDNFTRAKQEAEILGRQVASYDPNRSDPTGYGARRHRERLQEIEKLASETGFQIDPNTGQLVSRPDVPLVSSLTYYPDNLKAMMSPSTYGQYKSRFDGQPASQAPVPAPATGAGEYLFTDQAPATVASTYQVGSTSGASQGASVQPNFTATQTVPGAAAQPLPTGMLPSASSDPMSAGVTAGESLMDAPYESLPDALSQYYQQLYLNPYYGGS